MRRLALPFLCALPVLTCAQSSVNNLAVDTSVRSWLGALSNEPMLYLNLSGTEAQGKLSANLPQVYAWFASATYPALSSTQGPRQSLKVRIQFYANSNVITPTPTTLIVGDEVNLWVYDYRTNSYFSMNYGTYQGAQPDTYYSSFFRFLQGVTSSYTGYVANFLSQTYSAAGQTYQSWLPSGSAFFDGLGNANYTIGAPPSRNVIFVDGLDPLNNAQTIVTQVQYDNIESRGGFNTSTVWTMNVSPLSAVDSSQFKFVPPVGARVVAAPKLLIH